MKQIHENWVLKQPNTTTEQSFGCLTHILRLHMRIWSPGDSGDAARHACLLRPGADAGVSPWAATRDPSSTSRWKQGPWPTGLYSLSSLSGEESARGLQVVPPGQLRPHHWTVRRASTPWGLSQFWLKQTEMLVTHYYGFVFSAKKPCLTVSKKILYDIKQLSLFSLNQVTKTFPHRGWWKTEDF